MSARGLVDPGVGGLLRRRRIGDAVVVAEMPEVEAQRRVAFEHRAPVGGRDQPMEAKRVLVGGAGVGQDRRLRRRAVAVERVERTVEAGRERQIGRRWTLSLGAKPTGG